MNTDGFVDSPIDSTPIYWALGGSGPLLVLCDGFACDGFIWPYLIDDLLAHFTILRWHYRGHGNSKPLRNPDAVRVEDLCVDLDHLLTHLNLEKGIFAGHSMGVQVILQFFGMFPERVRALIPMCGTYKRPLDTFHNNDRLAQLLPHIDRAVDFAPDQLQALWNTFAPNRLNFLLAGRTSEINAKFARRQDFQPYLEHVASLDIRFFVSMLKELSNHSAEHILETVNVPTLIIAGEHDSFTPLSRSHEMNEMIDESELVIVPGGTHIAPLELPDLVNTSVEKFLKYHGLWPDEIESTSPVGRVAVP